MQSSIKSGKLLWAAALLTFPSVAVAQDNVSNNVTVTDTATANGTIVDPALNDTMGNDLGAANGMDTTALPADDTLGNDMALAQTAPPREDKDFPWGLLGLLGLAGLLGRKKRDDVVTDRRTDRRNV